MGVRGLTFAAHATSSVMRAAAPLFNHLVRECDQRRGKFETERLSGPQSERACCCVQVFRLGLGMR
jgi:hypothetical protein